MRLCVFTINQLKTASFITLLPINVPFIMTTLVDRKYIRKPSNKYMQIFNQHSHPNQPRTVKLY